MGEESMDNFNFNRREQPYHQVTNFIWNVLTIIMLVGVLCVVATFLTVFFNPDMPMNPLRPPALPAPVSMPTYTSTPRSILPATWTPTASLEPTITTTLRPTNASTPQPTDTPVPSSTPFNLLTPTQTTTVSGTRSEPFEVSQGTPISTSSLAFYPERGCDWMGVAGQIFDLSGAPISGQQVRIGGFLNGKTVDMLTLTGLTSAYGTAGFYEFSLADEPIASNKSLWLQLLDQAGLTMSEKIYFETYDSCEKNLIFINFKQVR
jgi:hypothetical protein